MHRAAIPFTFEFPVETWWKAGEEGKERRIGGVISTESKDRQGEVVLQRGLDFQDFLSSGWINDNHSKDTTGIVGYPTKVERITIDRKPATRFEGYLLQGYPRADEIWKLSNALQKTHRRLGFSIEGAVVRREGLEGEIVAKAKVRNVAVTNCFPGGVEVIGAVEGISRRFYSGPMVEIHLANGDCLTGTPHHPIFTQRGWVALGDLNEGHDRVGCRIRDLITPSGFAVPDDVQNVPALLEQIFDLARISGTNLGVRKTREEDFHGDGRGGDVDVVTVDGELQHRMQAAFFQKFGEGALAAANVRQRLLSRSRTGLSDGFSVFHAAPGRLGRTSQLLSLGGGAERVAPELFFVPVPTQTGPFGDVVDGFASDLVAGSDAGRALSAAVGFSDLRGKRCFEWSGHVFNLQTGMGWYSANNILSGNCPVNIDTRLEILAKSLMAFERAELPEDDLRRALSAGSGKAGPGGLWAPGDGAALRPESMELVRDVRRRKKITKGEAVAWLKSRYCGLTDEDAERILRHAALSAAPRRNK